MNWKKKKKMRSGLQIFLYIYAQVLLTLKAILSILKLIKSTLAFLKIPEGIDGHYQLPDLYTMIWLLHMMLNYDPGLMFLIVHFAVYHSLLSQKFTCSSKFKFSFQKRSE